MGKQDSPAVSYPVMKVDGSFRCFRGKVGSFLSDMKSHIHLPPCKFCAQPIFFRKD
jgi:hypothetical protein